MAERKIKQAPTLKRDPISILVYIIIILILYFLVGILLNIIYATMLFAPFNAMRTNVFDNNPLHFIPRRIYAMLYWQPILTVMTAVFNYIMIFIILMYIIWKILQMIPLLGPALLAIIPPFKQFEDAGIFALIDNIVEAIAKFLPKSIVRMFRSIFIDMLQFTKDKITDIVLIINPKLELDESQFDTFIKDMKKKNMEGFQVSGSEGFRISGGESEGFQNEKKTVNLFKQLTEESLNQKNLADKYKGLESVKPDMEMTDRMYSTFNNEIKKINIQLGNTPNNIKMQMATLP